MVTDPNNDLTVTSGSVADLMANLTGSTWTILGVYCKSDQAAATTFNLTVNGTNLFTAAQNCTSTGTTFSSFASNTMATNTTISQSLVAAATGNRRLSITVQYRP